MIEPKKILEELSIIHIGLRMNIFNAEKIVEFSDGLINLEENPDNLFIDISLASQNKNKLIDILGSFVASNITQVDIENLLSTVQFLFSNNQLNLESTVMLLYKLNNEFEFPEAIVNEIHRLDDQYHLASNKYVEQTIEELNKEMNCFLDTHRNDEMKLTIFNNKTTYNTM
jgi:hypothetical protein